MAAARRHRYRRPARQTGTRTPRRRLLVVCEGSVTERSYIRGFERWACNATVEVDIPPRHGDPRYLVEKARDQSQAARDAARSEGDPFLLYDDTWCDFDRDEHPQFADACQMARDNGILLAVSNPCFELWLLLHFRESPGMRERQELQRMMRQYLPGYRKRLDFAAVQNGAVAAAERARRLDAEARQVDEPGRNPTTSVYRLTDSILRTDKEPGHTCDPEQ